MKLFNIFFDEPQEFLTVKGIVKEADPRAIVTINETTGLYAFETQSEKAANALVEKLGGKLKVIEYDIKNVYK
jgi:hypothetical protein